MPCYNPLKGWRSKGLNTNGKRSIVFNRKDAFTDLPQQVPCGQCIGCRLERSRQWAIRCHHEASLHESNVFITLTYNDEHLPTDESIHVRELQLFMKRLRKKYPHKIRFYACGEYGENFGRPHYHACLFGHDFKDKKIWKLTNNEEPLYRSKSLEKLWPYGHSSIGEVTFQSAAYVARYIMKKQTGKNAEEYYSHINKTTGEITQRVPEFTTMSRRPGIGKEWLNQYVSDVYPSDEIIINGKRMKPPKFYDNQYEIEYPSDFEKLKKIRKQSVQKHKSNNTPERLAVREKIHELKAERLIRNLK